MLMLPESQTLDLFSPRETWGVSPRSGTAWRCQHAMSLLHRAGSLTRRMDDVLVIRWRLDATLSPGYQGCQGLVSGPWLTAVSSPC